MKYKAILFDLCGTLMQYRFDRLPKIQIEGETVMTTTPLLYACFLEFDRGRISFQKFYNAFTTVSQLLEAEKTLTGKEISSHTRFNQFLDALDADLGKRRNEIHRLLMDIHFERVAKCLELLPEHLNWLSHWRESYKLALVTNFDHSLTVHRVLARENITNHFQHITISDDLGLRKPKEEVFLDAVNGLDLNPKDCLFVGDSWECDIVGAKQAGLDAAWINTQELSLPQNDDIMPDYQCSDLSELSEIL